MFSRMAATLAAALALGVSQDLAGFAGYLVGTLPIGIFEASAKLGYYFHDVDVDVDFDNVGPNNGNVFNS